jgi:hypothetical protein
MNHKKFCSVSSSQQPAVKDLTKGKEYLGVGENKMASFGASRCPVGTLAPICCSRSFVALAHLLLSLICCSGSFAALAHLLLSTICCSCSFAALASTWLLRFYLALSILRCQTFSNKSFYHSRCGDNLRDSFSPNLSMLNRPTGLLRCNL